MSTVPCTYLCPTSLHCPIFPLPHHEKLLQLDFPCCGLRTLNNVQSNENDCSLCIYQGWGLQIWITWVVSEESMDKVMSEVIPWCWSVCCASRLAADWLLGKLTPLDFMRMSEMRWWIKRDGKKTREWNVCQRSMAVRYAAEQLST